MSVLLVRAKASDNATSAAENRSATRSSRATRRRSRTAAAAFDVLHWLQVTNNGLLDVVFDPAPRGSNYIDVWDWFIHGDERDYQTAGQKHQVIF
jgi:hypothetical protein